MKLFTKNKGTWAAVILFVLVIWVYNAFFSSEQSIEDQGAVATATGNNILALEQQLNNVNFDLSLFSSPTYQALVDFSPILPVEPVGRAHPFDPLGK